MMTSQSKWTEPEKRSAPEQESRQQPIWHVIVLSTLTMFVYSLVWFYKTWSDLVTFAKQDIETSLLDEPTRKGLESIKRDSPLLWTAMLALPGVQFYALARFFAKVVSITAPPSFFKTHRWLSGILLSAMMVGALCLTKLTGAWYLLYLTAVVPLAIAQGLINNFWKKNEATGLLVRHAFSISELAAVILGSLWLGLVVTGFSMDINK